MIDFACKRFKLDEVIKCGLSLTKAEYKVFEEFVQEHLEEVTTDELVEKTGLDITTIQRAVKKLHENNILLRKQINLEGGGYTYIYSVKPKKELRKTILNIIHNWVHTVDEALQKW
ncbi:MAG: helix-turn-helix domain-containing protein [Nanoarchaeota archaeon]